MKALILIFAALAVSCSAFSVMPSTVRSCTKLFSGVEDSLDRRNFLSSSIAVTVAAGASSIRPAGAEERLLLDYKAVANDIEKAVMDNPDWGPTLVRLAWHSSGTYDKMSKTGGSQAGTIRFKEELAHGGNAGLANTAVKWLEPIHAKYADSGLSYADLYTLAGGTFYLECIAMLPHCCFNTSMHSISQLRPLKPWEDRRSHGAVAEWMYWIYLV